MVADPSVAKEAQPAQQQQPNGDVEDDEVDLEDGEIESDGADEEAEADADAAPADRDDAELADRSPRPDTVDKAERADSPAPESVQVSAGNECEDIAAAEAAAAPAATEQTAAATDAAATEESATAEAAGAEATAHPKKLPAAERLAMLEALTAIPVRPGAADARKRPLVMPKKRLVVGNMEGECWGVSGSGHSE